MILSSPPLTRRSHRNQRDGGRPRGAHYTEQVGHHRHGDHHHHHHHHIQNRLVIIIILEIVIVMIEGDFKSMGTTISLLAGLV